jgi:hypothetical protein
MSSLVVAPANAGRTFASLGGNVASTPVVPDVSDLQAQLDALKAENEAMKVAAASKPKTMSMKVSEKGGLSVYGLGRFPVTLYVQQWERLFSIVDEVKAFIAANRASLKVKE